jgi:four helix bundle protein
MYVFGFEKLEVWQEARKLTVLIYELTEKFPEKEKFGLTNQMRRSSVSVGANIAEGSSRFSAKEQAHFYSISYGSLMELMSHTFTALDLKYINIEEFEKVKSIIQPLSLKINNLRNTQLAKAEKKV